MSTSLAFLKDYAVVAVLGLTGSGKSSFINQCVGSEVAEAGSRLSSITQSPQAYTTVVEGVNVCLVDTPGFDDTSVSDIDRLQEVSVYLTDLYQSKVNLTAIIYLQDIRVERIGGVALKNIRILEGLTGLENFKAITIATNFWTTPAAPRATEHEVALMNDDYFFGPMLRSGARYRRLPDWNSSPGQAECLSLLSEAVIGHRPLLKMQIQRELVDQGLSFGGTLAGQVVLAEVQRAQAHNLEKIKDLETKLNETLAQAQQRHGNWLGDVFRAVGRAVDDCILM
ncbi:50S ribosome-binding GTPase domain-containing protein [Sarocladium implicatum]|nr:50S ribosome-binding GTPase domain-containing protein [Sarocladium implicatum]